MKQYCASLTRDFWPLDLYKQAIISKLLIPYVSWTVCDMGSSYTWLYRSLPTIHNVKSLTFFDIDKGLLAIAEEILQTCSQEYFETSYGDTVARLQTTHSINADYHTIVPLRNERINPSVQYSFLDPVPAQYIGQFDTVVCLESLECCDCKEDLARAISHCISMLKPWGNLIMSVLRYSDPDAFVVKHLRGRKHEGWLNPDLQMLKKTCTDAGLVIMIDELMNTSAIYGQYGYNEAVFIVGKKITP